MSEVSSTQGRGVIRDRRFKTRFAGALNERADCLMPIPDERSSEEIWYFVCQVFLVIGKLFQQLFFKPPPIMGSYVFSLEPLPERGRTHRTAPTECKDGLAGSLFCEPSPVVPNVIILVRHSKHFNQLCSRIGRQSIFEFSQGNNGIEPDLLPTERDEADRLRH